MRIPNPIEQQSGGSASLEYLALQKERPDLGSYAHPCIPFRLHVERPEGNTARSRGEVTTAPSSYLPRVPTYPLRTMLV